MVSFANMNDFTNLALMLRSIWERELVMDSAVASLYNVQSSSDSAERTRGMGGFNLPTEYNGSIEYDDPEKGPLKTFTHKRYARGLRIPADLVEDAKYGLITTLLRRHVEGFNQRVAYHMSAPFINAFATTGDGSLAADAKALCSTDSARATGKADTRNKGTSALTHDAVVATRVLMRKWKDENGLILRVRPDKLVVPVELDAKADEICNSVNRSDNANNAKNTNSAMTYIVDPLLTDTNNWFVVDSHKSTMHLLWWWRVRPDFKVHPASDYDLELRTRGTMRYSFGADDHTWIYGHEVA